MSVTCPPNTGGNGGRPMIRGMETRKLTNQRFATLAVCVMLAAIIPTPAVAQEPLLAPTLTVAIVTESTPNDAHAKCVASWGETATCVWVSAGPVHGAAANETHRYVDGIWTEPISGSVIIEPIQLGKRHWYIARAFDQGGRASAWSNMAHIEHLLPAPHLQVEREVIGGPQQHHEVIMLSWPALGEPGETAEAWF